jgi:hypothetical protein
MRALAPDRIPRELLDAYSDVGDDPEVTPQVVDDAVELLLGYALLTATPDSTVGMHRLVQDVARSTAGAGVGAAAAGRAVSLVDRVLPHSPWEHEQWPACTRLLEHALTAASHAEQHAAAWKHRPRASSRAWRNTSARGPNTSRRASWYIVRLRSSGPSIKEAVYGSQHPEVASTLANLGGVQQELGELDDARECVGRALAIFERVVGSDHPRTRRTQAHLLSLAANTPTGSATARTPSPSSKLLSRLRRGRWARGRVIDHER